VDAEAAEEERAVRLALEEVASAAMHSLLPRGDLSNRRAGPGALPIRLLSPTPNQRARAQGSTLNSNNAKSCLLPNAFTLLRSATSHLIAAAASKDLLAGTQETTTTVYGTMLPPPPLPQVQFQPRSDDKRNNDAYEESKNEQEDNTSFGDGGEFSPIQGEQGGADSIQNGGVGQFDEILVESAVNYTFPERMRFFLGGNTITNDNGQAVEYHWRSGGKGD
jgi:hypothetical protein